MSSIDGAAFLDIQLRIVLTEGVLAGLLNPNGNVVDLPIQATGMIWPPNQLVPPTPANQPPWAQHVVPRTPATQPFVPAGPPPPTPAGLRLSQPTLPAAATLTAGSPIRPLADRRVLAGRLPPPRPKPETEAIRLPVSKYPSPIMPLGSDRPFISTPKPAGIRVNEAQLRARLGLLVANRERGRVLRHSDGGDDYNSHGSDSYSPIVGPGRSRSRSNSRPISNSSSPSNETSNTQAN
jgi:hypothetical protein